MCAHKIAQKRDGFNIHPLNLLSSLSKIILILHVIITL